MKEAFKNLKVIHFDFTPPRRIGAEKNRLRFVSLNVTVNVILSVVRSGATNEVEVSHRFLKAPMNSASISLE